MYRYTARRTTGHSLNSQGRFSRKCFREVGFNPLAAGGGEEPVSLYSGGTLAVGKAEYLGASGSGDCLLFGGSHSILCGGLTLGKEADAAGACELLDGSLTVKGSMVVGLKGLGAIAQLAGTNRIECDDFTLGQGAGSEGAYAMNGGSLLVAAGDQYIDLSGSGAFEQCGGNHVALERTLLLAKSFGAQGA